MLDNLDKLDLDLEACKNDILWNVHKMPKCVDIWGIISQKLFITDKCMKCDTF